MKMTTHHPPSTAEVKNTQSYIFTPPYVFMAWCLSTGYIFMIELVQDTA